MANIAFFGTPDFAATIFQGLIEYCNVNGHNILFAVCQPDRKKGRQQTVEPSRVKTLAQAHGITILQPTSLKAGSLDGDSFFNEIKDLPLDLAIVVAYGKILPDRILKLSRCGFVNVHASLLPRWRGASPIHHAILAGDERTGVSIMDVVSEMDAGDVYLTKSIPIEENDSTQSLTVKLAELGLLALTESIDPILSGQLEKVPQTAEKVTFAKKLTKEDGLIPWKKSAREIIWHFRAMHPWPEAYSHLKNRTVKLFDPRISHHSQLNTPPGTVVKIDNLLHVQCGDVILEFSEVQVEGKRRMNILDVKNGKMIKEGDQFTSPSYTV